MTDPVPCRCGHAHEPRERAVPCQLCHRPTADHHRTCEACRPARDPDHPAVLAEGGDQ